MRVNVRMLSVSVDVLMEKAAIRLEIGHTSLLRFVERNRLLSRTLIFQARVAICVAHVSWWNDC